MVVLAGEDGEVIGRNVLRSSKQSIDDLEVERMEWRQWEK
jgi:hypothetical protein